MRGVIHEARPAMTGSLLIWNIESMQELGEGAERESHYIIFSTFVYLWKKFTSEYK